MPQLLSLMGTTREIRLLIQHTVLCDFEELLRKYHLQPDSFRNLMRAYGAVIGGYTGFQFFLRSKTGDCSLDLYVANDDEGELFNRYLSLGVD